MSNWGGTNRSQPERAAAGLVRSCGLSPRAAETLASLASPVERYSAAAVISSIAPGPRLKWIVSGWACELRVLADGRRQIFSFAVPGDVVVSRPVNANNPCSLVALTNLECADVAQTLGRASEPEKSEILRAMERALSLSEERRYEHILRLGRRSASHRLADLLLELRNRLDHLGMVDESGFSLPLTQEHLADALGLSVVHVNRSLKALRQGGLATVRFGRVTQFQRDRLEEICRS